MVVCTLCSCYPWEVLGLPPVWYKSAPYRSRAVNDPRGVLADFGVTLPKDTKVRVWDSTAEMRFIVAADAARRHRGLERGEARRTGDARFDDRHRLGEIAGFGRRLTVMGKRELISGFLAGQIADAETQWSLGTFGAIAEFARDPDEPVELALEGDTLSVATARGGVRIDLLPDLKLIAFETTTKNSWSHRIALCLPAERCAMNRRAVLTELGPDADALRAADRGAVLFDLGIGALQVDVCVRVADPQVAAQLRAHCGAPVLSPGNAAMGIILAASPNRVFISRLGRIEVCQPIPPHDGRSPEGPHTHVLPDLLKHRRTHAATEPIPEGSFPCAHVYPPHPAKDALGEPRAFDPARHDAFQAMLQMFGDPEPDRAQAAGVEGGRGRRKSVGGVGHQSSLRADEYSRGTPAASRQRTGAAGAGGLGGSA